MKIVITSFVLFFSIISYSQIDLDTNFSMEIRHIKLKKTTFGGGGLIVRTGGYRFLIIDAVFFSKSDEREKFQANKMILKIGSKDAMASLSPGVQPLNDEERYVKFRNKLKTYIYFDVKDSFTKGELFYDNKKIGYIMVPPGSKKGSFKREL